MYSNVVPTLTQRCPWVMWRLYHNFVTTLYLGFYPTSRERLNVRGGLRSHNVGHNLAPIFRQINWRWREYYFRLFLLSPNTYLTHFGLTKFDQKIINNYNLSFYLHNVGIMLSQRCNLFGLKKQLILIG